MARILVIAEQRNGKLTKRLSSFARPRKQIASGLGARPLRPRFFSRTTASRKKSPIIFP